ncbi:GntR family transcriptional regulator [Paracoccus zhejiangensis]|uniref:GntR family transcriptional regulator n=1 Tax=Paracoccus zhejiangensis TaxID=1077935 RepID=A0A2H5F4U3_9RHOB|nr:GntR family transcriptional regulator [Paracoccus zhejiangensis]AUH66569.1 GntR family transcriptional regulator [Paracoccus zhejiangensis]
MSMQPVLDLTISAAPQVYDWLRDAILRGELAPGSRLSEGEIGKQIGVSRQPVREAFIRLTSEGLAEVRPQRGTFISRISLSAVLSARLIREAVESDLIRMVCDRADDALLARLDREIEMQRAAIDRDDIEEFVRLDDRFHFLLASAAEQEGVWSVLEGLKSHMNRLRHITARAFDARRLTDQHAAIVEGLRQRDADAAEQAMRLHLRELLADLPEVASSRPELFTK